jgi:hypothetical protein
MTLAWGGLLAWYIAVSTSSDPKASVPILAVVGLAVIGAVGFYGMTAPIAHWPPWHKGEQPNFSIVPGDPFRSSERGKDIVKVPITNDGDGWRFSVVLEDIEGIPEGLQDKFQPLHWDAKPNIDVEEIPADESRTIAVGSITTQHVGYQFQRMSMPANQSAGHGLSTKPSTPFCACASPRETSHRSRTRVGSVSDSSGLVPARAIRAWDLNPDLTTRCL